MHLKLTTYSLLLILMQLIAIEVTAAPPSIKGRWLTSESVINIGVCEGVLCGTIEQLLLPTEIDQSQLLDANNKKRNLRSRPMLGLNLLTDFGPLLPGQREYINGRVYHPGHGRSYKANLRLISDDQLEIEGCFLGFCQQERWRKLPPCIDGECSINPSTASGVST